MRRPHQPIQLISQRKNRGFTLLEMMITLMIFILLTASVFGIVTGVLHGSSTLLDNQNRRDQIAALNAYLKKKLNELPAESSLVSYQRSEGESLAQNGIILASPRMALAIDAKVQANGFYSLRLARQPVPIGANLSTNVQSFIQAITTDDPSVNWTQLIRDVKSTNWKFQTLNLADWVDHWDDFSTKPNLVEFTMQQASDLQPVTMDFWIPHLESVQLAITTQSGGGAPSNLKTSNASSSNP